MAVGPKSRWRSLVLCCLGQLLLRQNERSPTTLRSLQSLSEPCIWHRWWTVSFHRYLKISKKVRVTNSTSCFHHNILATRARKGQTSNFTNPFDHANCSLHDFAFVGCGPNRVAKIGYFAEESRLQPCPAGRLMQLVRLDVSSHALTGEIPFGLRALPNLEARVIGTRLRIGWYHVGVVLLVSRMREKGHSMR